MVRDISVSRITTFAHWFGCAWAGLAIITFAFVVSLLVRHIYVVGINGSGFNVAWWVCGSDVGAVCNGSGVASA